MDRSFFLRALNSVFPGGCNYLEVKRTPTRWATCLHNIFCALKPEEVKCGFITKGIPELVVNDLLEIIMDNNSVVGNLINFRGLVYSPLNENGVIFLFGKIAHDFNMYVEEIKPGFPDCIGRRFVGKGWEKVRIEFEYKSSNFKTHKHNVKECDIIICWEHDWQDCPIEVIERKSEIKGLDNTPISRPETIQKHSKSTDEKVEAILKKVNAADKIKKWFNHILDYLQNLDSDIWANVGKKYIGLYSPQKSFASILLRPTCIVVECFSGDTQIKGTKICNLRFSPRWVKFTVKSENELEQVCAILNESRERLKKSIKKGEPTAYFSGGETPGTIDRASDED